MRQFFNKASNKFTHIRRKTADGVKLFAKIGKHTLKDLRTPKEIGMFIVAAFVPIPGAAAAYIAYRIIKYNNSKKPANDNQQAELPTLKDKMAAKAPRREKRYGRKTPRHKTPRQPKP